MSSTSFFVLFESASGYGLFSILEADEIGSLLEHVQSGQNDLSRFQRVTKMVAFHPFETAENALENINAISEHELTEDLKSFLAANLSKGITANIQEDMSNLLRKSELFFDEADDLMDELEKKRELLDTSRLLDPFEFIRTEPLINLNESPDNFFERTVHNNNVGVIGFEAISSYVDISLQLPEPSHTF